MKIISLSILSIALSASLFARENPFEPTDHFLEQKEMIIQANERERLQQEQEEINRKAKELEANKTAEMMTKKEVKTIKIQSAPKAETMMKKKAYVPQIKENFKVLPFVKINVVNDLLTIKVDTKYKLLNQDILTPAKKLIFDFEGKVSFYTVRKDIISESFKSFAVGTHMEEGYFRVVIDLPEDIINYIEKIDTNKGIITIQKK